MTAKLGFAGWQNPSGIGSASFDIDANGKALSAADHSNNFFNTWMLLEASDKAFRDNREVYRVARAGRPGQSIWTLIGRYVKVTAETRTGYYFGIALMFDGVCDVERAVAYLNAKFDAASSVYLNGDVMARELSTGDITSIGPDQPAKLQFSLRYGAVRGLQPSTRRGFASAATRKLESNIRSLIDGEDAGLRDYSVSYVRMDSFSDLDTFHVELTGGAPPATAPRPTQEVAPLGIGSLPAFRPSDFSSGGPPPKVEIADLYREFVALSGMLSNHIDAERAAHDARRLTAFLKAPSLLHLLTCAVCASIMSLVAYYVVEKFIQ